MDLKESLRKNKIALISIAYVTVIFIIIKLTLGFHFASCDDGVLYRAFSGRTTGTPEMIPLFTSWVFSFIIYSFYKLMGAIEWYPLLLLFLMWLSSTVVCVCILKETKKLPRHGILVGLFIFTLLYISFFLHYSACITFSVAPACCGVAVVFLVLSECGESLNNAGILKPLLYIVLIMGAVSLREECAYASMAVLFGTIFIAVVVLKMKTKRLIGKTALILFIFGIVFSADNFLINDEWKNSIDWQCQQVGRWFDYSRLIYSENQDLYNSVGWSESDYNRAKVYMFIGDNFSSEKLSVLNEAERKTEDSIAFNLKSFMFFAFCQDTVDKWKILLVIILTAISCAVGLRGENKRLVFAPLCYFAGFLVLFIFLAVRGRYRTQAVSNVYILSVLPLCYCAVKIIFNETGGWKHLLTVGRILLTGAAAASVIILCVISYSEARFTRDDINSVIVNYDKEYVEKTDEYAAQSEENVYFRIPLWYGNYDINGFYNKDRLLPINNISITGWELQTPTYNKQLNINGIPEMSRSAFIGENVYLFRSRYSEASGNYFTSLILDYIREEYPNAQIEIVSQEETFNVLKISQ